MNSHYQLVQSHSVLPVSRNKLCNRTAMQKAHYSQHFQDIYVNQENPLTPGLN